MVSIVDPRLRHRRQLAVLDVMLDQSFQNASPSRIAQLTQQHATNSLASTLLALGTSCDAPKINAPAEIGIETSALPTVALRGRNEISARLPSTNWSRSASFSRYFTAAKTAVFLFRSCAAFMP